MAIDLDLSHSHRSRQENSFAKTDLMSKLLQFTYEISLESKLFSVYPLDQSRE